MIRKPTVPQPTIPQRWKSNMLVARPTIQPAMTRQQAQQHISKTRPTIPQRWQSGILVARPTIQPAMTRQQAQQHISKTRPTIPQRWQDSTPIPQTWKPMKTISQVTHFDMPELVVSGKVRNVKKRSKS